MDDRQNDTCLASVEAFLKHQAEYRLSLFDPERFIDLQVRRYAPFETVEPWEETETDLEAKNRPGAMRVSVQVESLLRRPDQRIVLSGVSGAGKTVTLGTLARRLSQQGLRELAKEQMPDTIPVWLPAARLPVDPIDSPVSWLGGLFALAGVYVGAQDVASCLLSQGRLLLLIDSLQEALTFSRGRRNAFEGLVNLPGIRIMASIRPGYEYLVARPSAAFLQLQGLGHTERERILRLREVPAEKSGALRRLVLKRRLCRAVEVPQIWQMAIDLQTQGIEVEHITSEARLYHEFVLEVLKQHTANDHTGSAGAAYDPTDLREVLELLGGASAFGGAGALSFEQCEDWVQQWLTARSRGRGIQYASGMPRNLLYDLPRFYHPVLDVSKDHKELSFAHGSLACFLAANWIRRTCRIMPPELLMNAALIDVVAFHAELEEIERAETEALDRHLIQFASVAFLCRWLIDIPRERIQVLGESLRERIRGSTSRQCSQLVNTLCGRSLTLARRLLLPLVAESDHRPADIVKAVLGPRRSTSQARRAAEKTRLKRLRTQKQKRLKKIRKKQRSGQMVSPLDDLLSDLTACRNDTETKDVLGRIAASGHTGPAAKIRSCLYSGNTYVIRSAVEAAATLGDPSVVEDIVPLLEHRQTHICSAAAKALGFLQDPSAVPHLIRILETHRDSYCINAAVGSLGLMGATDAAPIIRDLLKSPDPYCRGSAATALGLLGDPKAVEPLIQSLDPKFEIDGVNRGSAATALGLLGDPKAVEPLIQSSDSRYEHDTVVRSSAIAARGRLQSLKGRLSETDHLTEEEKRLHSAWERIFAQCLYNEAAPAPEHFDEELNLCLRSLEQWFGGRQYKNWHEKDYQPHLASLITAPGRYHATCEPVVADRQRVDILVYSQSGYSGSPEAVLELKKCARSMVSSHLPQLREYVKSLSATNPVRGYLIALDPSPQIDWTEADRAYEVDGLRVRLVHVGRQPPSSAGK